MSVLAFAELRERRFPKATLEVISYAAELAAQEGLPTVAVVAGHPEDASQHEHLLRHGADKIVQLTDDQLDTFNNSAYTKALASVVEQESSTYVVLPSGFNSKTLAPRLAARLKAPLATNVIAMPDAGEPFTVKRGVYSGKGYEFLQMEGRPRLIAIATNSHGVKEHPKAGSVEEREAGISEQDFTTKTLEVSQSSGEVALPEAEIVISGGRGMKGPENWHHIEELAKELGASTACSKPVSDMEWRPHSEHVGQTGISISPNLYIAVGISGAVQHLAGVSSSKVIVAINKDPEAPFFKAADYGIVGDAFEVLPKLLDAAKKMKTEA